MGVVKAVILATSLLVAMTAFADQRHDRKLWVAIDDGTEDGGLFINFDDNKVASRLGSLQSVDAKRVSQVDAITIISSKLLDDTTKEKLENVLSASGYTEEVIFVYRSKQPSVEKNATN